MLCELNSTRQVFLEGSSFETCTQKLWELVDKIKEIFLKVLQTIFPCFFKAPESIGPNRVTASASTTTAVTSATTQVLPSQTQRTNASSEERPAPGRQQEQVQQEQLQRDLQAARDRLLQQMGMPIPEGGADQPEVPLLGVPQPIIPDEQNEVQRDRQEELEAQDRVEEQQPPPQIADVTTVQGSLSLLQPMASIYVAMKAFIHLLRNEPVSIHSFNQESLDRCMREGIRLYEDNTNNQFEIIRRNALEGLEVEDFVSNQPMSGLIDTVIEAPPRFAVVYNEGKTKAYVVIAASPFGNGPFFYLLSANADPISFRSFVNSRELKEALSAEREKFSAFGI